ncbi:UV-endonuclease UvdE-domain-containing protein [Daedaleopsis nitida]|nr:UV-endonuclease UvdE-domain-containing protein [Daedaleopsis nitida]
MIHHLLLARACRQVPSTRSFATLTTHTRIVRILPAMAPKRKRTQDTEKTLVSAASATDSVEATGTALVSTPEEAQALVAARRVSTRKKKKVVYTEETAPDEGQRQDDGFESPLTEIDEEVPEEKSPKKKRRRKTKTNEPVVYDIPPVETKTSTFKGRLGYACLNTVLRASKPDPVFCSRTLRIDTILKPEFGMDYCKELGRKNAEDLSRLIQWNEDNHIKFLRMSSEMFPFASHDKYGYTLEYAEKELKAAGDLARKYGHRLTSHPGQFTQLGSPREVVVAAAIRDLQYHCQMFRLMGLGQDSVMIIHMGGMFGDKQATIERFREVYKTQLTDEIRARLVLENDEMCYNPDDLLPICEELDIPMVFDYHHNWIYPSEKPLPELIERINAIWHRKGIKPKQHLSEPCPGAESVMEKRKHADRCKSLPEHLPDDMDLMIEAKDKEQAVFHLYRIYNLHPVVHENLRPEKPPKPFPRSGQDGEGGGDGPSTPRKRKTRVAAKLEDDADEEAVVTMATGVSDEPKDLDDAVGPDTGTPKRKKRTPKTPRKAAKKSAETVVEVAEEDGSMKVEEAQVLLGTAPETLIDGVSQNGTSETPA